MGRAGVVVLGDDLDPVSLGVVVTGFFVAGLATAAFEGTAVVAGVLLTGVVARAGTVVGVGAGTGAAVPLGER